MRFSKLVGCLVGLLSAVALCHTQSAQAQWVPLVGGGTGVYHPNAGGTGGVYEGFGISTMLKMFRFDGTVQITGADGLDLSWQNQGYKTRDEQFHVCKTRLGQLNMRIQGMTQLIPTGKPGEFTAIWTGRFEIVSGTGMFSRARGYADVEALNPPLKLSDPNWPFRWKWSGFIRLL